MKSVLQISTPDEIGLVERASDFIFQHGGSIVSDSVRVFGDWAFILLHFEAAPDDVERMRSSTVNHPPFSGMAHVQLIATNEPIESPPTPTVLQVWCRDLKGLLARQTKLIQTHGYTILSHDGTQMLAGDEVSQEYRQTFTLSISPERFQERVLTEEGQMRRWELFRNELQQMLEADSGRFIVR